MKSKLHSSCLLFLIFVTTYTFHTFAGEGGRVLRKVQADTIDYKTLDGNRISCCFNNRGIIGLSPDGYDAGMVWPKETQFQAMYAACLWIGGIERSSGQVRVATGFTGSDYRPGTIDGTYNGSSSVAANQSDPKFRVYRISRRDAVGGVNPDYDGWPADLGAPVNPDGTPKFYGDQQIFSVTNDLDLLARSTMTPCLPLGIEIRMLAWCINDDSYLRDVIFVRWQIINKSIFTYDQTHVGVFADVDLGDPVDDQVCCDSIEGAAYFYNQLQVDYDGNMIAPAEALVLLDGPTRTPWNSPMTTFVPGLKINYLADLPQGTAKRAQAAYNYLCGLDENGGDIVDPTTDRPTKFVLAGDPVLGKGWTPDILWTRKGYTGPIHASDKRMIPGSGPCTFAPGDTLNLVVGIVLAQGPDRLSSLSKVARLAHNLRTFYSTGATSLPEADASSRMTYDSTSSATLHLQIATKNVREVNGFLVRQDGSALAPLQFFDDGQHEDGSAADGVFGTSVTTLQDRSSVHLDLQIVSTSGITSNYPGTLSTVTLVCPPLLDQLIVTHDDINGNGRINPEENVSVNVFMENTSRLEFDSLIISAYSSAAVTATGWVAVNQLPANASLVPSGSISIRVPGSTALGERIALPLVIEEPRKRNLWIDSVLFFLEPLPFIPFDAPAEHIQGTAPGTFYVHLADPSRWKNQLYTIIIPEQYRFSLLAGDQHDTLISKSPIWAGTWGPFVDGLAILPGTLKGDADPQPGEVYTFNPFVLKERIRPTDFKLQQNFPNPFNPSTTILYSLYSQDRVVLKVYDLLGREIGTLVDETQITGDHSVRWDGRNSTGARLASGVYFYRLRIGNSSQAKKMVLVR